METLVKTEELFNTEQKKVMDRDKKMRPANDPNKVLNCHLDPRVTLGRGSVTKGKKNRVITVPPQSQPGYFIARNSPPRVAK